MLSAAEDRSLRLLEPLLNATPEMVSRLRDYAAAVGGASRADYADHPDAALREHLRKSVRLLVQRGDSALWIGEAAALGGFGFRERGRFFNADTVRFLRVISLLDDAEIWRHFSGPERRTVWEIGGGWGGFAYQFKRLCPTARYLITGLPTTWLLSAVYLMTLFPGASFRFYDRSTPQQFWRDWDEVDFAFAPEDVVSTMHPPGLELVLDVGALSRMTAERVELHTRRAHALGARYFSSSSNSEPSGDGGVVRTAVERMYWPHPVAASEYVKRRLVAAAADVYFLGWKRLHV
jgi:hypothetical protein